MHRTYHILICIVLGFLGRSGLQAQTVTLYFEDDKTLQRCKVLSVSEFNVSIEQTSFIPTLGDTRNLALSEIIAVRETSRISKYAPYFVFLGSYVGVNFFFKPRDSIENMTWSERFATMLDTPVNFITAISAGGAAGYLTGYLLLGGNRELIILQKLSDSEKYIILSEYIHP